MFFRRRQIAYVPRHFRQEFQVLAGQFAARHDHIVTAVALLTVAQLVICRRGVYQRFLVDGIDFQKFARRHCHAREVASFVFYFHHHSAGADIVRIFSVDRTEQRVCGLRGVFLHISAGAFEAHCGVQVVYEAFFVGIAASVHDFHIFLRVVVRRRRHIIQILYFAFGDDIAHFAEREIIHRSIAHFIAELGKLVNQTGIYVAVLRISAQSAQIPSYRLYAVARKLIDVSYFRHYAVHVSPRSFKRAKIAVYCVSVAFFFQKRISRKFHQSRRIIEFQSTVCHNLYDCNLRVKHYLFFTAAKCILSEFPFGFFSVRSA